MLIAQLEWLNTRARLIEFVNGLRGKGKALRPFTVQLSTPVRLNARLDVVRGVRANDIRA